MVYTILEKHKHVHTSSGILTTWYKRVHDTCLSLRHVCTLYVQCLSTAAYIHAMYKYEKSWTCTYMYIHFWKCMYTYVHGMYMVCTKRAINVYVHRSDMYDTFIGLHTHFGLYKHVRTVYKRVHWLLWSSCWVHSSPHTFHEMYRHCWTGYVHGWTGYVHCWTWYLQDAAFLFEIM